MIYEFALEIAEKIKSDLAPHCERIEIAGSIRRKKPEDIKDVEIVCIPKPYNVGLFRSGIAEVIEQWPKVKGDLPCKYTQRIYGTYGNEIIKVDIFFANPENWGLILAIRTGSAEYSHKALATTWSIKGYKSENGMLYNDRGNPVPVREEKDLFDLLGMDWVEPENRL
ncbi:hypothetical protein MM236_19065 [Belliella sp. DSM 107340]|uniref:DNA polymerase beta thumb domain-containing protein n=1 Tax=Belliella calami TaxID=2923436 RepID=A0ABS9UUK2_9BACT|nr:hypothetical protein [Belliella calami]MCH7400104.1 hypothetical protein [Belliella calami]